MPDEAVSNDNWHEALTASFAKLTPEPAPVESAAEPVIATDAAPAAPAETSAEKAQRERDEKGRFKPSTAAKSTGAPTPPVEGAQEPAAGASPPPAPAAGPAPVSEFKAPQSWTPAEREAFAKAPTEVQKAAIRREREITSALQETAQARQTAEAFQRTIAPYEHMFRAAGKSSVEGVGWLVQQYAALQTAPMAQRARIIAGLQRDFLGVDEGALRLLAAELDGTAAPVAPQPAIAPQQIQQLVRQQIEQERAEAARQAEIKAIQEFEASQPEHLADVTQEMAAFVTIEKQQGKPITTEMLQRAYERAIRANPEVSEFLKRKEAAAAAEKANASTQRAKASSVSVKPTPGGPSAPALDDDWRSHLSAAWDASSNR